MSLQPKRTVAELKELRALTGDEHGAQRVCWTDTWLAARAWLRGLVEQVPGVVYEVDEAGNAWATLRGASDRAVLIGGHIDSVPNGGWLDGCLNLVAGLEVLRRVAAEAAATGAPPPVTIQLVDWADEEGARFGRSLLGSAAAAGQLDPDLIRGLTDRDGIRLDDALARCGVDVDRMGEARRRLDRAAAYLELHIEQGPVLESMGLPLGAVLGTVGVERNAIRFTGQAAHSGSTPMDMRRDAFAAAAKLGLEIRDIARRHAGVCTMGSVITRPGIVTAVVGECDVTLDQRNLDAPTLAAMLADAQAVSQRFAAEEKVEVAWTSTWSIPPIPFDPHLIDLCDEAIREVAGGRSHRLPSGPLHDAASVAQAGVPTVMLFVQSLRGLSHNPAEDTLEEHLELCVEALDRLSAKTVAWVAGGGGR
jgi:N-carbamoyl-L-amino-acid hydrolase